MHYVHRLSVGQLERLVGLFVLLTLLVAGSVFYVVARSRGVFEEVQTVRTLLLEGHGLRPGSRVMLGGLEVGTVQGVGFSRENRVEVTMQVLQRHGDRIRADSVATVGTAGLVGDPVVKISLGSLNRALVPKGGVIPSEEPETLGDLATRLKPTLQQVEAMVDDLRVAAARLADQDRGVARLLERTERVLEGSDRIVADVLAGKGSLGALIQSREFYDGLLHLRSETGQVLGDLGAAAAEIRRGAETLPGLASAAEETARRLPELLATGQALLEESRAVARSLREASGQVSPLLRSARRGVDEVSGLLEGARQRWPFSALAADEAPVGNLPGAPRDHGYR